MPTFRELEDNAADWITIVETDYYPDYLSAALETYKPHLKKFREIARNSETAEDIFKTINEETGKERVQLLRIFRRYVSPDTSVEMLKTKKDEEKIINDFGDRFRDIDKIESKLDKRDFPDETIVALLAEYESRGFKGYEVEERVFQWFENNFRDGFELKGPRGAGRDIYLDDVFDGYPTSRPVDFVLFNEEGEPELIGLARYDGDRGGAQEDDRVKGYMDLVKEITGYSEDKDLDIKILFVNDGPGLLLGSMWEDYSLLEEAAENVKVCTLKMLDEKVSEEWVLSDPITEGRESAEAIEKEAEEISEEKEKETLEDFG